MHPIDRPNSSAALLWLPIGVTATSDDFDPNSAEVYWFAHEAVQDAVAKAFNEERPGKEPWIRFGEETWNKAKIAERYQVLVGAK